MQAGPSGSKADILAVFSGLLSVCDCSCKVLTEVNKIVEPWKHTIITAQS